MNLFKHVNKSKSINPKITIILIILAGTISSVAYATTTVISDTGIITSDLTVTGTCTGCGGEGSFNSYSLIYNNTISGTNINNLAGMHISNDKSVLVYDNFINVYVINSTQKLISATTNLGGVNQNTPLLSQSGGGEYKVVFDGTSKEMIIFKGNSIIQHISINTTQFSNTDLANSEIAISNDGKYIGLFGQDSSGIIDRLVIWQGS